MAAAGAAETVGRYVRTVILNSQFGKAGAKIGNFYLFALFLDQNRYLK